VGDAPDEPTPATLGALSNPNGLWVQPDGTFYVLDLGNAKIRKVTPEGEMSTLIAMDSLPVGRGLWVAPDESEVLIAAGSEVRRWTPEGGSEVVAGGFASLGMVLRSPDGRILVGDRAGHRVYAVGTDGTTTPIAGTSTSGPFQEGARALETPLDEPRAIWPYGGGLFIGLHNGRRVLYVDAEGITHLILQGSGDTHAGDGEPWDSPGHKIGELRSLSVSAQDLIIVENDAGFVRVVRGGA
jgi:serine/threonine-protein kinase